MTRDAKEMTEERFIDRNRAKSEARDRLEYSRDPLEDSRGRREMTREAREITRAGRALGECQEFRV
jgi:hypothetical protein